MATGATEPLPFWLEGVAIVGRDKASAVNHLLSFRARFLGSDARGFAAKSVKDTSMSPSLPREEGKAESAKESAESSASSTSSSSTSTSSPSSRTAVAELAAVFTCNVCDLRSAKGFSRVAYERGVVIVTCGGCTARHVLADRLGWFGAPGAVDDFLAEAGEAVRRRGVEAAGGGGVLEVTEEELAGWSAGRKGG